MGPHGKTGLLPVRAWYGQTTLRTLSDQEIRPRGRQDTAPHHPWTSPWTTRAPSLPAAATTGSLGYSGGNRDWDIRVAWTMFIRVFTRHYLGASSACCWTTHVGATITGQPAFFCIAEPSSYKRRRFPASSLPWPCNFTITSLHLLIQQRASPLQHPIERTRARSIRHFTLRHIRQPRNTPICWWANSQRQGRRVLVL